MDKDMTFPSNNRKSTIVLDNHNEVRIYYDVTTVTVQMSAIIIKQCHRKQRPNEILAVL
jgi:hypothetical protein